RGKLSTLSRAYIHADEVDMPTPKPDLNPFPNILPMHTVKIPSSNKSPFPFLTSLTEDCTVIFTDDSTIPNPGIGDAAIVVQSPSISNWLELEFPIQGITANIGCEIEGMRQALKYVDQHCRNNTGRTILSDCKFVLNAVKNICKSEDYH